MTETRTAPDFPLPETAGVGRQLRRALRNAGVAVRDAVIAPIAHRADRDWVVVGLDKGLGEAPVSGSAALDRALGAPRTLAQVLQSVSRAAADPRVFGLLVRAGDAALGWSHVSALARGLIAARDADKRVVVYAESSGNAGAWLGALADHFWLTPEGRVDLLGIRLESVFLKDVLERLHVRPDVISAGRYKSAGDMIDRDSLSDDARENLDAIADDLYAELVSALARRAGGADAARAWIDAGPYLASEAVDAGIADALVYADELPERLAALQGLGPDDHGEPAKAKVISEAAYGLVALPRFRFRSLATGARDVAVVPVLGTIQRGPDASKATLTALSRLAEDDEIGAVVLRINSPGGDPLTSDLLWRATRKLAEKKPVVASLGDVAASGGYYVAMAAHEIWAEATTLTGSVGVVLAGVDLNGVLDSIGIAVDGVQRGAHASIYSPLRKRSAEEHGLLDRQVRTMYTHFVDKAAESRGIARDVMAEIAEGRVWTGAQALENKLVDGIGGLDRAVLRAGELARVEAGQGAPVFLAVNQRPWARYFRRGAQLSSRLRGPVMWWPFRIRL